MIDNLQWEELDQDGLTYLLSERKEVMKAYQKLVGILGNHLDQKTRQLIMLAIQVNSPSPEAVKIIIPKAMKAGATREEIIDSILLTVPIVGLSTVLKMLPIVLTEIEKMEDATRGLKQGTF